MSETMNIKKEETIFFPGCALQELAPSLCDAVFEWLQEQGIATSQRFHCCGLPFKLQGNDEVFLTHISELYQLFETQKIQKIVTACPSCYRAFNYANQQLEQTFTIEVLPAILAQAGMRIADKVPANAILTIHDSCPDRKALIFADAVRELAEDVPLVEMKHTREKTMCCGVGEPFYHADIEIQKRQIDRRCQEALDVGATHIMSACVNCTAALDRSNTTMQNVHYLELLFEGTIQQNPTDDPDGNVS